MNKKDELEEQKEEDEISSPVLGRLKLSLSSKELYNTEFKLEEQTEDEVTPNNNNSISKR